MREIVVIQIGHCGNNIGSKFWEVISDEHGVGPDGRWRGESNLQIQRLNVYFYCAKNSRGVPRAVCIDLDGETNSIVRRGPYGNLISPESIIAEGSGTGNNWAKGFHTLGPHILPEVRQLIRRLVESTDCLQGFQLCHSLGGGTGSGFGSLLQATLKEEYPDKILCPISVYPSSQVSDVVVEPYNCILGLHRLIESPEEVIMFDNGALHNICKKKLKLAFPSYDDLNHLVSTVMAGTTASFRFPGQLNTDLRKVLTNMVPFPRLHFFSPTTVPLISRGGRAYTANTVQSQVLAMFDPEFSMCAIHPKKGKFLTAAAIFRGRVSTKQIDEEMVKVQTRNSYMFSEWIPNGIKTAVCDIPPRGHSLSASFLGNHTAIQEMFRKQCNTFNQMIKKKAFLHWYKDEGMEETDFKEAENNVRDLISEYEKIQEQKNEPEEATEDEPDTEEV